MGPHVVAVDGAQTHESLKFSGGRAMLPTQTETHERPAAPPGEPLPVDARADPTGSTNPRKLPPVPAERAA